MRNFLKNNFLPFNLINFGTVLLLLLSINSFNVKAQAPGASCAAAVLIQGTGAIPNCTGAVTISDFATDGVVPSCITGTYRRDGWYSFINPVLQNVTVTATSTTASSNLIIQILGVCGGAELGCANNFPANGAQTEALSLNLAAGTYFIKLTNYSTSTPANMALSNVCVNATPVNNDCANATGISPGAPSAACAATAGTTAGATQQATIPATCTGANTTNDDVWYSFVATATTHVITVTSSASFNAVFEVFSSNPCGGAGTSMGCTNANGAGGTETATLTTFIVTNTYWVRVYDAGTGIPATSAFTICVQTPPVNDDCVNAITLTPNAACVATAGDVNVATNSGIAVSGTCAGSNPDDDVWYTFTATGTSHTINVTGSASFDPGFEVFTGTCGALTSVLCNAPGGNSGLTISSILATGVGTVYYIRVYDYANAYPATTGFTICILNPPPPNDDCAGAISLTPSVACVPTTGNVSGATQSFVGCAGNANDDVWYSFTTNATAGQQYVVTVVGSASFDPVFQVYSTSCGGTSINCTNANATLGGTETTTLNGLATTTTYWVRVYDANAGYPATTTFTICITLPPTNNDCNGPTLFVWGTPAAPAYCGGTTAGTLAGATGSGQAATCGGTPNDDVWYAFVATSTTNIVTVVPCATLNAVVQAYSTSCGGTSIGCANVLGNGGTETLVLSGLTAGSTYWVRVYDFTGTSACNTFTICVATPPVNDPCASATNLTPAVSCTLVSGTVNGGTMSLPANCGGTVTSDVWYTFTAGSANQTITVNGSAGINLVYELFSTNPCGGAGTSLGCVNATGVGGNETFAWTTLTGGAQYWIRVYDFTGAPTTYTFAICVVTPSNDQCANATTAVCGGVYAGCTTVACGMTNTGDPNTVCGVAATTVAQGVWYVFAGTGQNVVLTTCGGTTNYDTELFVYTGSCGSLTCLVGNDDMCNPGCVGGVACGYPQASRVSFATVVGTNYYIFVTGWNNSTGNYTLTVTCAAPPVNDICTGAITVSCGSTYTGSTITASSIGDITSCGTFTAPTPIALWYLFAGDSTYLTVNLCGGTTNFDTQIGVWSATSCGGPFTCVAGNDNTGGCTGSAAGNASSVTFITTQGVSYYIEVSGAYSGAGGNGTQYGNFTLNLTGGTNPGNAALTGCAPLPIQLISFTAQAQGPQNLIEWKTATETNNDYFTIEKADDAISFMTLTKVNGAGNSISPLTYRTYDTNPVNGTTYYRLKQTDYNGAYTYSSIISVNNKLDKVTLSNVHPNPTTNDINFDFYSTLKGKVHIQILDYLGRTMEDETQTITEGSSALTTKMTTLSPGVYSLKVSFDQTGFVSVTKIIKN